MDYDSVDAHFVSDLLVHRVHQVHGKVSSKGCDADIDVEFFGSLSQYVSKDVEVPNLGICLAEEQLSWCLAIGNVV